MKPVAAIFLSVAILLSGHGLQLTLVPLYADQLGWTTVEIGYTGSAYFMGFILGCLVVPKLVARVGHIRILAVLSAGATSALLLLAILTYLEVWLVGRLITGCAMAGIYVVIENWLNESATRDTRGTILGIYTMLTLIAICVGQQLISVPTTTDHLVMTGAVLLAVGVIPVLLTQSPAPQPPPVPGFKLKEVYREAHVAVIGAFMAGLVTAGFWVLGPLVARAQGLALEQIGIFMAATLLGGAIWQIPAGKLSDRIDRRWVILLLAAIAVAVCVSAMLFAEQSVLLTYLFMFLFGGATFPLYALCLAHANDNTALSLMEVGSVILMVNSAGAMLGPIAIAWVMRYYSGGLFAFSAVVLSVFCLWCLWRLTIHHTARKFYEPFSNIPKTSQTIMGKLTRRKSAPLHDDVRTRSESP